MVAQLHACPECGEPVAPGRLSCPGCGTVLASVARRVDIAEEPANGNGSEPTSAPVVPGSYVPPAFAPVTSFTAWPAAAGGAGGAAAAAPPLPAASFVPGTLDAGSFMPERFDPEPVVSEPLDAEPIAAEPVFEALEAAQPAAPGTGWPDLPAPPPAPFSGVPERLSPHPVEPPPAPILPRSWDPAEAARGTADAVDAGATTADVTATGSTTRIGRFAAPRIDRARVEEVADTIMLVGSFGLVLSFLVPWARIVLGSRGAGYFETWGLAGSGHLAPFVLALGVLALAVVQNPIGRWLRTGVLGVALGGFALGIAWPYVVGPLGAGPGALLAWISGVVMLVAGIVSLLVLRHAALPPDV